MKTFADLEFKAHPVGRGLQAKMDFDNGYGVSVLFGTDWYSNGTDTYELAVFKDGHINYEHTQGDVMGYKSSDEVTSWMRQVQELKEMK